MSRRHEIAALLHRTGKGGLTGSAYDAGWLARLGEVAPALSGEALDWLRSHQLPDGTWGAAPHRYHHDRTICTLSAIAALARSGDPADLRRAQRARPGLVESLNRLAEDTAGETIGFELIAPLLLEEVVELGVVSTEVDDARTRLRAERERKLSRLPAGAVSNRSPLAHSAEMVGPDGGHLLDLDNLTAANGSVGLSPAATAYYTTVSEKNDSALSYLNMISDSDGGVPNVGPVDVFEITWTLWNIGLTSHRAEPTDEHRIGLLKTIRDAWAPGRGASFGAGFTPEDGDDTALVFEVLSRAGQPVDLMALLSYAGPERFHTWPAERNPSVSTNVHALGALRAAGLPSDDPHVRKVLEYLAKVQDGTGRWVDKWHASPYYPTAHAVIAGVGLPEPCFERAVRWIEGTQGADGSWGHFGPTAEETAYSLQALVLARRAGLPVRADVIEHGYTWLSRHGLGPYPWLYIGKCLYSPDIVVRSTILSALLLVEEER